MSNAACVWALWTTFKIESDRRQPDRSAGTRPRHCRKRKKAAGCQSGIRGRQSERGDDIILQLKVEDGQVVDGAFEGKRLRNLPGVR